MHYSFSQTTSQSLKKKNQWTYKLMLNEEKKTPHQAEGFKQHTNVNSVVSAAS
jgi:hypothetical protein